MFFSLSLPLFLFLSPCLSVSDSLALSFILSVCVFLSLPLSHHLSVCVCLSLCPSVCMPLCFSLPLLSISRCFSISTPPTLTFPSMSHRSLLLSLLIIYSFLLFYCATGVSLQNLDELIHYITTKSAFASVYSLWFVIVPSSSFVYLFHRSFFFFRLSLPPFLLLLSFISSTVPSSSFVYLFHRSFFFFRLSLPPFLLLLSFISSTVPSSSFVYLFHRSFFFFRLSLPPFLLPALETSFFTIFTRAYHFFVHLCLILFISK